MTLHIDHEALIKTIAATLEVGLERDGWDPTKIGASDLHPKYRALFAMERARNIVTVLINEQTLAEEDAAE
jgi:flagellar basal body L-ring protein FlgH